jgi:DNA (cytosine-5)-methyltransferase 1
MKPRLVDLFCGAGGAAMGYHQIGFDVVGVDLKPQPHYPFEFHRWDALMFPLAGFDAAPASPPCQAFSDLQKQNKREYPELIAPIRERLRSSGLPYVIENVEGAPLIDPVMLCGTMFPGLRVLRHRLFETNFPIDQPAHPRHPLVFTHDKRKAHHGLLDQDTAFVQVTGGGNCTVRNAQDAMGIPPAYTMRVGRYLMAALERDSLGLAA